MTQKKSYIKFLFKRNDFVFVQVGEGEKMVKALFAVARELQPSIIFIGTTEYFLKKWCSKLDKRNRRLILLALVSGALL